jgi:hypothetical protein
MCAALAPSPLEFVSIENNSYTRDILRLVESFAGGHGVSDLPRPMLHVYFDESGKFQDKDYISFCGWVAPLEGWENFSVEWDALLERHRISHVHMAGLMNFRDEFEALKKEWGPIKRDRVLDDFANLIRSRVGYGVLTAFDTKHFRQMSQKFRDKIKNPHFTIFRLALNILMDKVALDVKNYPGIVDVNVSIICDQDAGTSSECLRHVHKLRQIDARARDRLVGVCFCDSKSVSPLQAADMLAYTIRAEIERRSQHPHLQENALVSKFQYKEDVFGTRSQFSQGILLDGKFLDELEAGKHGEAMDKILGLV